MQCGALLMAENQINFDLCILCQTQKNEQPVDNPASHEKVVEFVKEWAKLSDLRYLESNQVFPHSARDGKPCQSSKEYGGRGIEVPYEAP